MRTGIPFLYEIRQPTSEAMLTTCISRSHKFRSLQPQGEIVGSHASLLANAARIDPPLQMMDGWGLFRGRHYYRRGRSFALRAGFHKAQPPQAGTPASISLAMWLNLQWQCKMQCLKSRIYRERTSLRIMPPSVARPENALGDVCPVDEAKLQPRRDASPFSP